MYKSILVPIDGSEHSRKALSVACHLASGDDARVYVLHVPEVLAHDTSLVWGIGAVSLKASRAERERHGRKMVDKAAADARELGATQVETIIGQGDPAQVILAEASQRGIEAIVMGSRGLTDFKSLLVGSVSHKVSHVAECSVITVH